MIKTFLTHITTILIVFLACCNCEGMIITPNPVVPTPMPVEPVPTPSVDSGTLPSVDSGTIPAPVADCVSVCKYAAKLGCDIAKGSPGVDEIYNTVDDINCVTSCVITTSALKELNSSYPVNCILNAKTCAVMDYCK